MPNGVLDPYAPPAAAPSARPRVIAWFRAYAASMALLCLMATGLGVMALFSIDHGLADPSGETTAMTVVFVSVALGGLYTGAAIVPLKPWGWTLGIVAIAIGLTSCTIMFAIPLLVYWLKPAVKAAFRRPPI